MGKKSPMKSVNFNSPVNLDLNSLGELLEGLFRDDLQISSFLLENLKPISRSAQFPSIWPYQLRRLSKVIDFLDHLGWVEHTGDWDPFLGITKVDGTVIETESGYWNFNIGSNDTDPSNELFTMEIGEDSYITIPVHQIQQIDILC